MGDEITLLCNEVLVKQLEKYSYKVYMSASTYQTGET